VVVEQHILMQEEVHFLLKVLLVA